MKPGQIRIIAGKWKGSPIVFPAIEGLRPTPVRVRETLFNWLQSVVSGANCLDLFAGSGALSLEALSRGAGMATTIDQQKVLTRELVAIKARLNIENMQVICQDSQEWLQENSRQRKICYDIVFLDPPFSGGLLSTVCQRLENSGLLSENAYIYVEYAADDIISLPDTWQVLKEKQAGHVKYQLCMRG
jgi:16S rRNA (guanine966-N2)-methyltransferase